MIRHSRTSSIEWKMGEVESTLINEVVEYGIQVWFTYVTSNEVDIRLVDERYTDVGTKYTWGMEGIIGCNSMENVTLLDIVYTMC
jgi:hypothetical protein